MEMDTVEPYGYVEKSGFGGQNGYVKPLVYVHEPSIYSDGCGFDSSRMQVLEQARNPSEYHSDSSRVKLRRKKTSPGKYTEHAGQIDQLKYMDEFDYDSSRGKLRRKKMNSGKYTEHAGQIEQLKYMDEFDYDSSRGKLRRKKMNSGKYTEHAGQTEQLDYMEDSAYDANRMKHMQPSKYPDECDYEPSTVKLRRRKKNPGKYTKHTGQIDELEYMDFPGFSKWRDLRGTPGYICKDKYSSSRDSSRQSKNKWERNDKRLSTPVKRKVEEYLSRHVEKGGHLNIYGDTGVDVTTDARVLFDAVRHGKNHLVRFILDASSVDIVNSRDLHGKTPLMACCYTKEEGARDNTVRLLLRHGADVNATDDCGRTALSYVCERRCNDILRILIKEHNVDPDITDTNGNTPLIYSAMVGNDIACDILIRHFRRLGLSIEARNDEGFTALLMAAKHGNITCAQILVGQGKASTQLRDSKHGLSVEEWLAKKGFTLQDIKPVRQDGKGRSRFVKLANIAAICSAPKKHIQAAPAYGEIDFALNRFQLGKIDDDDSYYSDATTATDLSNENFSRYLSRYNDRYNDLDLDFAQKHYRIYPCRQNSRPKLKTSSTQTQTDGADDVEEKINDQDDHDDDDSDERATEITVPESVKSDAATDITVLQHDPRIHLEKKYNKKNTEGTHKTSRSMEKTQDLGNKDFKRLSLPEIEHTPMVSRSESGKPERKRSLDVLPEKLIASIDLGDGRKHSIQLHPDSIRNKVYWSPVGDEKSEENCENNIMPLKFERERGSVSDSETSMNEDGPIF